MVHRASWIVVGLLFAGSPAFAQFSEEHNGESVSGAAAPSKAPVPDLDKVAKLILEKTNAFREKEGRQPVKSNEKLKEAAQYFAEYMARTGKFSHTADGQRPSDRVKKHGYDYCIVAENIAYVFDPAGFTAESLADKFVVGWENSPHHRRNMLDRDVMQLGVGVARSEKTGYYYAVQDFGRPKSAAIEFKIENHSTATIQYKIGDQTFELPPRYIRTHERCRPGGVTFEWPGDQKSQTVKPANGDRYIISGTKGQLQAKKV
jgi:uncharacterized protein YkwD